MQRDNAYSQFILEFEGKPYGSRDIPIGQAELVDTIGNIRHRKFVAKLTDELDVNFHGYENFGKPRLQIDKLLKIISEDGVEHELLLTNIDIFAETPSPNYIATATKNPIGISKQKSDLAFGLLANGPQLTCSRQQLLKFSTGKFHVTVEQFKHSNELFRKNALPHVPPRITHHLKAEMNCTSDTKLSVEGFFDEVSQVVAFLSFVKGTNVGFGMLQLQQTAPTDRYDLIGFTSSADFKSETNWYFPTQAEHLPKLFKNYLKLMSDKTDSLLIGRALAYYRASNAIRRVPVDVALIIMVAGLEACSNYILSKSGKWSNKIIRKLNLEDRLRNATIALGIQGTPDQFSIPLQDWIDAENETHNEVKCDGFSAIAKFRNGLAHTKLNFNYTSEEMIDVLFASQWLLEVLLLRLMSYEGKYKDLRRFRGSLAGELSSLP